MDSPNFGLDEAHRQFRDTLAKFAADRIAPNAAEADREATYPQKSFDACVELELPPWASRSSTGARAPTW